MNLQVLVSTMNQIDHSLIEKMNITSDAVIINQCSYNSKEIIKKGENKIKVISVVEKGLSKSRNMAIKNITSDICILADDDIIYENNYEEIILNAFEENPQFDIICFCLEGIDQKFKKYSSKDKNIGWISSMKISSVEIAFRSNSIINNDIKFNELFGTGAEVYSMGEENIFLYNCLRHGLKIKFKPKVIGKIFVGDSTWFRGYNEKYFFDKGAAFTAMSSVFSIILIIQFAIRKRKLFNKEISVVKSIKLMLNGRRDYLKRS